MTSIEKLDVPLEIGPVRLANRAVLLAQGIGLGAADGALSDRAIDWICEQARHGWGAILLGLDAPGCPGSSSISAETLQRIVAATGGVELGLALAGAPTWDARLERFAAAGVRMFEASVHLDAPPNVVVGLRREHVEDLEPGRADYYHLGPWYEARQQMVGGPVRHPYVEQLDEPFDRPLMLSGRIRDAVAAERVLRYYPVDLAGIGRGALADPQLLDRARRGEDWMPCTGCMACLAAGRFDEPGCAVTWDGYVPWGETSWTIVGTSAAAAQVALALDSSGHRVALYTADQPIGGALRLRGRIPDQAESMEAAVYLRLRLRNSGVDMHPGLPAQAELLASDHCLVSLAGAVVPPELPELPEGGDDEGGPQWLDGLAVLGSTLDHRGPFAVWGESLLAAELVAFFAMTARPATLVCDPARLAADTHPSWARHYRRLFADRRVRIEPPSTFEPAGFANVAAGLHRTESPVSRSLRSLRASGAGLVEVADAYEPFSQRQALEAAFREVVTRLTVA